MLRMIIYRLINYRSDSRITQIAHRDANTHFKPYFLFENKYKLGQRSWYWAATCRDEDVAQRALSIHKKAGWPVPAASALVCSLTAITLSHMPLTSQIAGWPLSARSIAVLRFPGRHFYVLSDTNKQLVRSAVDLFKELVCTTHLQDVYLMMLTSRKFPKIDKTD